MILTLGWAIWMFAYMIARIPLYWRVKTLQRKGRIHEANAIVLHQVESWAGKLLRHIKMQVNVVGRENLPDASEPVVFVANHQSYLDIPLLMSPIHPPHPLLAKQEILKVPMLGKWMLALGCITVDRNDIRGAAAALKEAEQKLVGGTSLIIFPEGTRSKSPEMGSFKAGAVRIAWKAKARIVPVAIEGTYRSLEGNRYRVQPNTVTLTILPPVVTSGLSKEDQHALPQRIEQHIAATLPPQISFRR